MVRILGLAALRFLTVVAVAITFAFLVERFMPRVGDDPTPWLDSYLAYWQHLMEPAVAARLLRALPWTVAIIGTATVIAFCVGTVLGAWMGRSPSRLATLAGIPVLLVACVPAFLIAMIVIAIVAQQLRWLPPAGPFSPTQMWRDPVQVILDLGGHAILPILTITLAGIGTFTLSMRSLVAGGAGADHGAYGVSLGLASRRRFWAWEVRPALAAQLTAAGLALGLVVSGAFLVEAIFSYPGLGWVLFQGILNVDLSLVRGAMVMIIIAVALITTLIDLALPLVDPRIRR
jgi:peptide/nickel transport system permease protein